MNVTSHKMIENTMKIIILLNVLFLIGKHELIIRKSKHLAKQVEVLDFFVLSLELAKVISVFTGLGVTNSILFKSSEISLII